ncbi:MAG: hypothetical protein QOE45_3200 [Frankiaceae bacterium]|jgi:hypothetical protein|nr:hypothetical protein [Frankiaceae bacterium]
MTPRRWAVRIAGSVVALIAVWAVVAALSARSDVNSARDRLLALKSQGGDPAAASLALDRAAADLRSARSTLRQPGPALVARVPVLGRTWTAIRAVDESALDVVLAAREVLAEVRVAPLVGDHRVDVRRITAVAASMRVAATRTEAVPSRLSSLETGWTPPGVTSNVAKARSQLGGVPAGLRRSADLLDALAGVLGARGDRRILVVLENNAELRGAGGLVSVFAEATAHDGAVALGEFRDVVDVAESRGFTRPVPAPADYVARYGRFLANTTLWRNANMSPDIPTSSKVLTELAALSLKRRPDAVITLDVPAIARILGATGPATLPDGRTLTQENAVEELLSKAYAGVPDTRAGQDERRRRLRVSADAVVGRLFSGDAPAVSLGVALGDAAAGRHVAVWSARADEQRAIDAAGASGAVRDDTTDLAMTTIQNFGGGAAEGNKLDFYARVEATVSVRVEKDAAVTTRTFHLLNSAPASGLPRYVAGVESPGEMRSFVGFALPAASTIDEFSRDGLIVEATPEDEGRHRTIDDFAALKPGAETTWTLRYTTPLHGKPYTLRVVPQPLAVNAQLTLDVAPGSNAHFGAVRYEGPFDTERRVEVVPRDGHWWERIGRRIRKFWTEPIRL